MNVYFLNFTTFEYFFELLIYNMCTIYMSCAHRILIIYWFFRNLSNYLFLITHNPIDILNGWIKKDSLESEWSKYSECDIFNPSSMLVPNREPRPRTIHNFFLPITNFSVKNFVTKYEKILNYKNFFCLSRNFQLKISWQSSENFWKPRFFFSRNFQLIILWQSPEKFWTPRFFFSYRNIFYLAW